MRTPIVNGMQPPLNIEQRQALVLELEQRTPTTARQFFGWNSNTPHHAPTPADRVNAARNAPSNTSGDCAPDR